MQQNIHPAYENTKVVCSCGNSFEVPSTLCKDQNIEICSNCHPFYTGQQKVMDTAGKVDKFNQRFAKFKKKSA